MYAEGVESANIVGYTTVPEISASQYVALGVVFEDVAGGEIAVKDLVTVGAPLGSGSLNDGTDQIWRWDTASASWTKYFWYSGRGTTEWRKADESAETTDTVSTGDTVFFLRSAGATEATSLTLSGAVKNLTGNSDPITLTASQLSFMSNPWPTAINVADFSNYYTSGSPIGSGSLNDGTDQIWRWNRETSTWTKYYYYSGRGTTEWRNDGGSAATTDTIPAGEGFFFQRSAGDTGSATIQITAPVTE